MENLQEHGSFGMIRRKTGWVLYLRYFLLLFIPLMALFIGVAATIYHTEVNADIDLLLAHEAEENIINHLKLMDSLERAVSDLKWMANRQELRGIFEGDNPAQRNELAQEFLDLGLFSIRKEYDQFRILDDTGMEVLRVQLVGDEYTILAEAKLQDKSDRYYFSDAFSLERGMVYMSDLDLNIEHGEIEVPYKPVIRFATPIFDVAGQKSGVLVTNMLAQPLLDRLTGMFMEYSEHSLSSLQELHKGHTFLLIDKKGHYLRGETREDEWGGSLGKEPLFPKQYPEVWAEIAEGSAGIHKVGQGYLLTRSIHLCADPDCPIRTSDVVDITAVTPGEHSPFHWKLIAVVPGVEIAGIKHHWFANVAFLVMVLSLIWGLGAFVLARAIVRRILAEKEILHTRNRLQAILDNTSSVIFIKDLEGRYLLINKKHEELFHISNDEIIGKTDFDLFPPDAAQAFQELDVRALAAGASLEQEESVPQDDGIHTYITVKFPLLDADGKPYGVCGIATDITERKAAERALRESEEQLRNLFDNMAEGAGFGDLDDNWLFANTAMERIHGVGPGELIGRNVREFLVPEQDEMLERETARRIDGETSTYEATITRPDGQERVVRITGSPRRDAEGNVVGTYGIVHDITEKHEWELALKQSEQHYRELVEATDAVAWELDWASGEITYMARQIEQLTGYPAEDWPDMETWLARIHEGDRDRVFHVCSKNTEEGKDHELEYRFVSTDGEVVWVRELVSVVVGQDGPEKIRGLMLDITKEKNAILQANREYSKLKLMISTMEDGVAFADAQGTVVEINDAFSRLLGISNDDVLGKGLMKIHQGLNEHVQRVVSEIIEGYKKEISIEPFILQQEINGKEVIFKVHPIFREGHFDGVMKTIIDVSEIVEARKKAEEASRAKSMFLANISHELRTPLTIINGFAEVLLEHPSEKLTEIQTKYISQIQDSGNHLLAIISDLLDLARIDAGRMELYFQQSDLTQICETACTMAIPEIHDKAVEVGKDFPPDPAICNCDPIRVRQVVINLLANAWKFTEKGKITLRLEDGEKDVLISVEDTGIGIKQTDIARLLEPFEQVQDKFETEFVGTGLGLALSKGIVEAHGGTLQVKSELGVGSTFTLSLPKSASPIPSGG